MNGISYKNVTVVFEDEYLLAASKPANLLVHGDGTGAHYIQIHVRRADYDEAYSVCKSIMELLDSGVDEKTFNFGGHIYVCRPRRAPILMSRDDNGGITFYYETVIYGDN